MSKKMRKTLFVLFPILFFCFINHLRSQDMVIEIESLESIKIKMYHDTTFLGSGTGFIIKPKDTYYILTNRHNFTMQNVWNDAWINDLKLAPNRIEIDYRIKSDYRKIITIEEKLFDKDGQRRFKTMSYKNGQKIDVTILPISNIVDEMKIYSLNLSKYVKPFKLRPYHFLSVVGYPSGMSSRHGLPIWKTGFIASEPDLDQQSLPIIWMDIETDGIAGMSGSPVYYIRGENERTLVGIFSHGFQNIKVGALWKIDFLMEYFETLD